jgi:2-succinyl-6-hydroxy-2,4-cyclohexadiene-1-carboxylate synthase
VLHPTARELVTERAQQHVGVMYRQPPYRTQPMDADRRAILLHGFTHTGLSWEPVSQALGGGYAALAPDIRGHGRSSDRQPVTLETVIDDVAALAPARFTLVGYSMGGRIALHIALALSGRVERLLLIGASPGIADPAERRARRQADERLADEIEGASVEEFAHRWAATPLLAGQPPSVLAAVHADRLRNTPEGLARALRGLGTGALPSLWQRLGELPMPVTLAAGRRDHKFHQIAARMAAEIPAARVEVVDGAGHAAHLEAPDRVARLLVGSEPRSW